MNTVLLFDVDGTLVNSGQKITKEMSDILIKLSEKYELGIVGGGTYEKINLQLDICKKYIIHFFTESGSVYYKNDKLVISQNMRKEKAYEKVDKLKKIALNFLSNVNYTITGNFIDQRTSLVYISLIGLNATQEEREYFMNLDNKNKYKEQLYNLLNKEYDDDCLEITYGGSVGIAITIKEWNKTQVLKYFNETQEIHYFGDKYEIGGNDYELINHKRVTGHKINNINEMYILLQEFL